jgi:tetratricopeptide (TPR) repeat protein
VAQHTPPAEEQAFDPGFDADLFWAKHQKSIIGGAAVLIIAGIVALIWIITAHNSRLAAEAQFSGATDVAGWRAVIQSYPHSMPAADSYFLLAQALREEGKIDESNATYQDFLKNFPSHPMVPAANLGLAQNQDLQGKTEQALAALRELQAGNASGYVAPFAALLEGQILMREGKLAEASRVFSTAANLFPKSPAAHAAGAEANQLKVVIPPAGPTAEKPEVK